MIFALSFLVALVIAIVWVLPAVLPKYGVDYPTLIPDSWYIGELCESVLAFMTFQPTLFFETCRSILDQQWSRLSGGHDTCFWDTFYPASILFAR